MFSNNLWKGGICQIDNLEIVAIEEHMDLYDAMLAGQQCLLTQDLCVCEFNSSFVHVHRRLTTHCLTSCKVRVLVVGNVPLGLAGRLIETLAAR